MWRSRSIRSVLGLCVVATASAGCVMSSGGGSCVGPTGQAPATAAPGETITVSLAQLWDPNDCPDTNAQRPRHVLSEVTVTLERASSDGAAGATVATATAKVNDDADHTATVDITVPQDARGDYTLAAEGLWVGTITVAPAP